jgi:hypothetical protein
MIEISKNAARAWKRLLLSTQPTSSSVLCLLMAAPAVRAETSNLKLPDLKGGDIHAETE